MDVDQQYGREARLFLTNATGDGLDLSNMRIKFVVGKKETQAPNVAEIRVYNLSENTIRRIQKEFSVVTLQAGYKSNFGVIFKGNVTQLHNGRENSTDTYLDIIAGDGDQAYNFAIVNTTLAAGSSQNEHLTVVRGSMSSYGVEAGFTPELDSATLPRGKVMFGMSRDHARRISDNANSTWSIQDGRLQLVSKTSYLPGQAVVLNSKSGLIGTPEQAIDGIKIKCLLNPLIRAGGRVHVDQKSIQLLKLSVEKKAPINAPPKIEGDGFYRVLAVQYSGDTRGTEWYASLVCVGINATAPVTDSVTAME